MKISLSKLFSARWTRVSAGLLVSALCMALALRDVALQDVRIALAQADARFIAFALGSVLVNTLSKAARWRSLLGEAGRRISGGKLVGWVFAGQMINNFVPGRVGDLSRAYAIGGKEIGRTFALGSIVLEKLLDLFSYTLLLALLLLLIPLPAWFGQSAYTIFGLTAIVGVLLMLIVSYREITRTFLERLVSRLPERVRVAVLPRLQDGLSSLAVLQKRSELLRLALWSTLIWTTALLNNYLMLFAFRLHLSVTASLLLLLALIAGISLSNIPGTIGVFEWICVLALTRYGVDQATAFSYGMLLHVVVLLPIILVGALSLLGMGAYGTKEIVEEG